MPTGYFKLTVFILFFSMSSVVNLSVFPIYDRDKKNRVLLTRFIFLYTIAEYWTIWILFNNSIWPTGAYSLMRRKYFCMSTLTSKERCYFEFLSKCEQKKKKKKGKKLMVLSPFFFLLLFFFVFCVCNEYLPWQQNKHTNKDLFFQHLHHKRIHTHHNRLEKNLLILRSTKEKKSRMLYMPSSTLATPIVLQETQPVIPAARYVMLQPTAAAAAVVPTVPLLSPAFMYPKYTLAAKTTEKDDTEKYQGIRSREKQTHT